MMKHQISIKITTLIIGAVFITNCSFAQEKPEKRGGKRPSTSEIFSQMDSNKDNQLTIEEVRGPLKNDFAKIDANDDGYISKEELEKAPKPQGGRPPRR